MKYLFDSNGYHIANEVSNQLYAPSGQNIGHLMRSTGFFIDMQGYYLGEIVFKIVCYIDLTMVTRMFPMEIMGTMEMSATMETLAIMVPLDK